MGYWIHKSALCPHILHEFVVLLKAKLIAKPQTSAIILYGHNARVWYPISDLLHLRNDVLIGCA